MMIKSFYSKSWKLPFLKKAVVFSILFLFIVNISYTLIRDNIYNSTLENVMMNQREEVAIADFVFKSNFKSVYNDLFFLVDTSEFQSYLLNSSETNRLKLNSLFSNFAKTREHFLQIRFLDEDGMEKVRVNQKNGVIEEVETSGLQNKANRYYFQTAASLERTNMYVSNFDLNIENGAIVEPYEPTVRFAIPIYEANDFRGIVIINYDGYDLMSIFSEYNHTLSEHITTGLLDTNNYWSLQSDNISESVIGVDASEEILSYYDGLQTAIIEAADMGRDWLHYGDDFVNFQLLSYDSTIPMQFEFEGGEWIVISRFDESILLSQSGNPILKFPWFRYIVLLFFFLLAYLVYVGIFMRERHQMMLVTSGFISDTSEEALLLLNKKGKILYCNKRFEKLYNVQLNNMSNHLTSDVFSGESRRFFEEKTVIDEFSENLWELETEDTYILRHFELKHVCSERSDLIYQVLIIRQTTFAEEFEYYIQNIQKNGSSKTRFDQIEKMSQIIEEKMAKEGKPAYAITTVKFFNNITFQYDSSNERQQLYFEQAIIELKSVLLKTGILVIPTPGIVILCIPLKEEDIQVQDIMNRVDRVISMVRMKAENQDSIDYLVGIALSRIHGERASEILNKSFVALEALFRAKHAKGLLYNQNFYELIEEEKIILAEIDQGFENDEFYAVYQLQRDVYSNQIVGMEALARWDSPQLGLVSPNRFIPVMEESGKIKNMALKLLKIIIKDLEKMETIPSNFIISFNLSAQEFVDEKIVNEVIDIIEESSFSGKYFCVEITEGTLVDNFQMMTHNIRKLHGMDMKVAIDDFGSGYSSLGYLHMINVDKLKVDRIFIQDYPNHNDGKTLKAISHMIQDLKIPVIIEGIETEEQLKFIRTLDFEQYQGFFGAKPLDIESIIAHLNNEKKKPPMFFI